MWFYAHSFGFYGEEVCTSLGDRPELGSKKFWVWWVVFGEPKLLSLAWPQEYVLASDCYKEIIMKGYL